MPFLLLILISLVALFGALLPLECQQFLYTLSLSIKALIIFALPFIIFLILFKIIAELATSASKVIGLILVFVCVSNLVSTFLSSYMGSLVYGFDLKQIDLVDAEEVGVLLPLWDFALPSLIPNSYAMFGAIFLGVVAPKIDQVCAGKIAEIAEIWVSRVLKVIIYLVPLFVVGFIVKLKYEGIISLIVRDYASIFMVIMVAQFGYIILLFLLLCRVNLKEFMICAKNMAPAAIAGLGTMSSAASMPLTIIGAERNARDKHLARAVISASVNIHLIGDCFAIPILAYAVLKSFGLSEPSLMNYLIFTFYFVLAKFSVAAIPGGGILVMLPILEAYLGFNAQMMSLITTLYILFEPVITSANVFGNGAFAKMVDQYFYLTKKRLR